MSDLTHLDPDGNAVMVDVSNKQVTERSATAAGSVYMLPETLKLILNSKVKKGDVLSIAQLAGIMGAKKTSDLIPLCHQLDLTSVQVKLACDEDRNSVDITATCKLAGKTGVEMEAITAVTIAALTVYDMCKAVDRGIRLSNIRLVHKEGGKSGIYTEVNDGKD